MAQVIDIRSYCDDTEDSDATPVVLGACSNCHFKLISQPEHGFPIACPQCHSPLENGTDDRAWIVKIYSTAPRSDS